MRSIVFFLCALGATSSATPSSKPVAIKITPEIEKFAAGMGTSFDQLVAAVATADQADHASKFDESWQYWRDIRQQALDIEQQAALAARVGAFGEPMRFPTKKGKLTPKAFVTNLRAIAANAGLRSAKAMVARDAALDAKQKKSFPDGVAAAVEHLESSTQQVSALEKKDPSAALRQSKSVLAIAVGLRQSVAGAVTNKRADANTRYPLKPKPATGAEVIVRLDSLIKDQKARLATLQTAAAAAAKAKTPAVTSHKPPHSSPTNTSAPVVDEPVAVQEGAPVEAPIPGETCNDEGASGCDFMGRACCPGKQCLPAGWTCGAGCDGLTGQTPEYYACLDPVLAPKP